MKNSFLLLWVLLSAPFYSAAQKYTVVHMTGRMYHAGTTSSIKPGEEIQPDEQLIFPGQRAWAILIDDKGEQSFLQQPDPRDTSRLVKHQVQPIEKIEHPVTRVTKGPVQNLRTYFAGTQFVFIGDDFYLEVDPKQYPLDEKLFLLYRYEYRSRIITHKIPVNKQVIHFNKEFLYEYKGDTIPYQKTWNTELAYFNSNTNLPTFAAGFRPIWLSEDSLKNELIILQKVYAPMKKSKAELKKIFLHYVLDIYGKTDEIIFMDWVEETLF